MPFLSILEMMCRHRALLPLLLACLLPTPPAQAENAYTTANGLIFNTVCARCHEGECRGQLSFSSGRAAALTHIRRYAGLVSEQSAGELFTLLRLMKEKCAFAELDLPVPADGQWSSAQLLRHRLDSGLGYFIPLGTLTAGEYRLALQADSGPMVRVEVIAEDFDLIMESALADCSRQDGLRFRVDRAGHYYLRVSARQKMDLNVLHLSRAD